MRVNRDFILEKFKIFSDKYFNSELPVLPVRITNAKSYVGKVVYERKKRFFGSERAVNFRMLFSRCLDLEETTLADTVLHEMIHYWILYKGIKDTSAHGEVFRRMMNDFNLRGHNITISHRVTESEKADSLAANRGVIVAVVLMDDSRLGVTVAMKSKIGFLWRELLKWERVRLCKWYYVSHPFFSFFPKSKTVKVYPVDREKLTKAMSSARELIREGDRMIVSRNPFEIEDFR